MVEFNIYGRRLSAFEVMIAVLGISIPLTLVIGFLYTPPRAVMLLPMWIVVLAWITALPFVYEYTQGGQLDPFAPIFWVAPLFFFTYGAPAGLRLLNNDFSFSGNYTASVHPSVIMVQVLVLASVGLLAVCGGYYWSRARSIASVLPTFNPGWSSRRAWIAIGGLMTAGVIGYLFLRPGIGTGPRTDLAKGTSKYAFIAVNLLNTASILVIADNLIRLNANDRSATRSYRTLLTLVGSIGIVLFNVLVLWTMGGRGRAFGVLIVVLFLIHYLFRRFSMAVGMSLYSMIKLVPAWGIGLVTAIIALDFGEFFTELGNPYLFLASPNRPFNNIVVLFAGVPDVVPFQYGTTFLSAFFALIPYQPVPQTQIVYNRAFLPGAGAEFGVPITMLGELYLNFWIPGIVIGLFTIGVVMRVVYNRLVLNNSVPASLILFATITNSFLIRGNFSNSAPKLGLAVLPIIVSLYYISDGFDVSQSTIGEQPVTR